MKQQRHVEGSHVDKFLADLKRWAKVDGVHEFVMDRLNKKAEQQRAVDDMWTNMAQADILNTVVDSVRLYDSKKFQAERRRRLNRRFRHPGKRSPSRPTRGR